MIYGYMKPNTVTESAKAEEIVCVAWNEYCNYKSMLESCVDESSRPILEAKVEVLREVSIQEIVQKIREKIHQFIEWVRDLVKRLKDRIAGFFDKKNSVMKAWKNKKISTGESTVTEAKDDNIESTDEMLLSCLTEYNWRYGQSTYKSSEITDMFDRSADKLAVELEKAFGGFEKMRRLPNSNDVKEMAEVIKKNKTEIEDEFNRIAENAKYEKSTRTIVDGDAVSKKLVLKFGDWYYKEIQELDTCIRAYEDELDEINDADKLQKAVEAEILSDKDTPDDVKNAMITQFIPIMISMMQNMKSGAAKFSTKLVSAQNLCVSRLSYLTKYAKKKSWIGF